MLLTTSGAPFINSLLGGGGGSADSAVNDDSAINLFHHRIQQRARAGMGGGARALTAPEDAEDAVMTVTLSTSI